MSRRCSRNNLGLGPLSFLGIGSWKGCGLAGAAWVTAIAFFAGLLFSSIKLKHQKWTTNTALWQEARRSWRPFTGIAAPAMVSQLMPPLASMLAIAAVASLGDTQVAAWGLASRLETVSLMVILAMTMSLPPWLGRCYGAGDWAQIQQLMRLAVNVALIWQLSLGLLLALASPWVAMVLAGNQEVQSELALLIRFLLPSYAALGVCMLVVSAGNALGWPLRAMLLSSARLFICYLPCLWLGAQLFGWAGLAAGAALGNVLAGIVAWIVLKRILSRPHRQAGFSK